MSRKGGSMRRHVALTAWLFALPFCSFAADYPVQEVRAIDGKILCFAHHNLIVTQRSGPCDGYVPPSKVGVGQSFVADGKTRTILVIHATQTDKDFKTGAILKPAQ